MDKYKRYYGILTFIAIIAIVFTVCGMLIQPKIAELRQKITKIENQHKTLEQRQTELTTVQTKIKRIKDSISSAQKKIYSPIESDLGNDTLFFTLYNDLIEMIHANSVKIKTINYTYNPESDEFVKFGKDVYFVCDIDMELVSNYVNLGKLIQDIYQYPYYIRINSLEVRPYEKDKTVLVSNISLRLYAHTSPTDIEESTEKPMDSLTQN